MEHVNDGTEYISRKNDGGKDEINVSVEKIMRINHSLIPDGCSFGPDGIYDKFGKFIGPIPMKEYNSPEEYHRDCLREIGPQPLLWKDFNKIEFPIQRWRIKNLIPLEGFVILAAVSGEGKTWIAMEMANAIAQGRNFLNTTEFETIQGNVLYLDAEMSRSEFQRRGRLLGLDGPIQVLTGSELNLGDENNVEWLLEYVENNKIDVIIVDTFRAVAGGLKEEKAEEVRAFFNRFRPLKSEKVAVIFLDHFRKPQKFEGKIPQKEHLFASQDKAASVESLIMMKKQEETGEIYVYQRKNRLGREIEPFVIKMEDKMCADLNTLEKVLLSFGGSLQEDEKIFERIKSFVLDILADEGRDTNELIAMAKESINAGEKSVRQALRLLVAERLIQKSKRGRLDFYTSFQAGDETTEPANDSLESLF